MGRKVKDAKGNETNFFNKFTEMRIKNYINNSFLPIKLKTMKESEMHNRKRFFSVIKCEPLMTKLQIVSKLDEWMLNCLL